MTTKTQTKPLTEADIKPYARNAKKHPSSQLLALANIVREVGWRQPALVNLEGTIIAGHGRWFTYQQFKETHKLEKIWVIDTLGRTVCGEPDRRPMTAEQENTYRFADNKLNESEWDMELAIPDLKLLPMELFELTGFDRDLLLDQDDKDDEVPEVPVIARSKLGDLYELGPHRVLCGDATKESNIGVLMDGQLADMVFTDPPYNVNYEGGGKRTTTKIANDNLSPEQFLELLMGAFARLSEFSKRSAAWYVCHSHRAQAAFEEAIKASGYRVKAQIIWEKPSATLGMQEYRSRHEPIFYCVKEGEKANFYGDRTNTTIWKQEPTDKGLLIWLRKQIEKDFNGTSTVWRIGRENVLDYAHPTQKPVALVERAVVNSSKADDIILDTFLGSGSTLITAQKANRQCFGMELDPRYVDVVVQRYVDYTGDKKVVLNGKSIKWQE